MLVWLEKNEDFIVVLSDKNQGPCIMERIKYMELAWSEHLSNTEKFEIIQEFEGI